MAPRFFSVERESAPKEALSQRKQPQAIDTEGDLPPVVARMVVEIRSDGSRTIARGALEDLQTGERVALQANAKNPVELARELTKSILKTPALAGSFAKDAVLELLPEAVRNRARKLSFGSRKKDR